MLNEEIQELRQNELDFSVRDPRSKMNATRRVNIT